MDLEKIIEALSLEDAPDDIFDQIIPIEEITDEHKMEFLTDLSGRVESSLTLKFLSNLIVDQYFSSVDLHAFMKLYPSEPDFTFKALQLITLKQADDVLSFYLYSPEDQKTASTPLLEKSVLTEIAKMKNLTTLVVNKYYLTLQDLMLLGRNMPGLKSIKIMIDTESKIPTCDKIFAQQFSKCLSKVEEIDLYTKRNERNRKDDLIIPECLEFFLKNVGKNLNTLSLENYHEKIMNVDLNLIQENCTKLENLIISNGVKDGESLSKFTSLRNLQISFRNETSKKVLLSNILAAPNLETVRLSNFRVTSEELKATISLVENKAILTKVKSLVLRMYKKTFPRSEGATEEDCQLFKSAVQEMRQNEAEVAVDCVSEPYFNVISHMYDFISSHF